MKTTYENEFREIEQRIRKAQCEEIVDMLWEQWSMMLKALDNGRSIFEAATGERFERLYVQRMKILDKMSTLSSIAVKINKMY